MSNFSLGKWMMPQMFFTILDLITAHLLPFYLVFGCRPVEQLAVSSSQPAFDFFERYGHKYPQRQGYLPSRKFY